MKSESSGLISKIGVLLSLLALFVAAASLYFSWQANDIAHEANLLSKEANEINRSQFSPRVSVIEHASGGRMNYVDLEIDKDPVLRRVGTCEIDLTLFNSGTTPAVITEETVNVYLNEAVIAYLPTPSEVIVPQLDNNPSNKGLIDKVLVGRDLWVVTVSTDLNSETTRPLTYPLVLEPFIVVRIRMRITAGLNFANEDFLLAVERRNEEYSGLVSLLVEPKFMLENSEIVDPRVIYGCLIFQ